jgi:hypothetical protein
MSLGTGGLSRRELLRQLHEGIRATGEPDWSLVLPDFEIYDPSYWTRGNIMAAAGGASG